MQLRKCTHSDMNNHVTNLYHSPHLKCPMFSKSSKSNVLTNFEKSSGLIQQPSIRLLIISKVTPSSLTIPTIPKFLWNSSSQSRCIGLVMMEMLQAKQQLGVGQVEGKDHHHCIQNR